MHDVSCALQQAIGEIFPWRIEHLRNSRSDPAGRQAKCHDFGRRHLTENLEIWESCSDQMRPFATIGDTCGRNLFLRSMDAVMIIIPVWRAGAQEDDA